MNIINLALSTMDISVKTDWGVKGLIIGLGSVFIILVLLIGVINLLKLTSRGSRKQKEIKTVASPAKSVSTKATRDDENEIIAAIAAAISCMAQREGKIYKIKSFKRVGSRVKRSYKF